MYQLCKLRNHFVGCKNVNISAREKHANRSEPECGLCRSELTRRRSDVMGVTRLSALSGIFVAKNSTAIKGNRVVDRLVSLAIADKIILC